MKPHLLLLLPLLMALALFADIKEKIKSSETKIESKKMQEQKISHELDKIAKDMLAHKKSLLSLSADIKTCKSNIKKLNKKSSLKQTELDKIDKIYKKLAKQEKLVSKKVVNILSKELSIQMISKGAQNPSSQGLESFETNVENIVMNEILHTYTTLLREKFKKTKSKYIKLNKTMDTIKNELSKLSSKVDALKSKKADLDALEKKRKKSIHSLKTKKDLYVKKLKRLKEEQEILSSTLTKLNVTKSKKEQEKIRKQAQNKINVRQIGSSYQHGKLASYKGKKTIPPLKAYTLTQKFGNYTDPIYKIKIFNEAVTLHANKPNSKVRNVLDGTIIYAEKTPVLDNVVIVKHRDNIHTIYAHLSKIAPTIKVGKRVKKSYVLGRVLNTLTFEVTQDSMHINPMELIK